MSRGEGVSGGRSTPAGASRKWGAALALLVLTACSSGGDAAGGDAVGAGVDSVITVPAVPTVTVTAVAPASYTGTLPCPDCSGVSTTVSLFTDTTYRAQQRQGGKGEPMVRMGRWVHDGGTLTLEADTGIFLRFTVASEDTLRLSDGSATLVRADSLLPLRETATFVGSFTNEANASTFRECGSGQTYAVLTTGGYRALERAYRAAKLAPGSGWQVEVRGRFTARPGTMEGARDRDVFEVVKYVQPSANPDCR